MMLNLLIFFTAMSNIGLRNHQFKLYTPQAHLEIRKKLACRVIDEWNIALLYITDIQKTS